MSLEESYHHSSRSPFVLHPNMVPEAHSSHCFSLRVTVQPLTAKTGFRAAKGDYQNLVFVHHKLLMMNLMEMHYLVNRK